MLKMHHNLQSLMIKLKSIRLPLLTLMLIAVIGFSSCGHSPWDEMPVTVSNFVDKYFNEGTIAEATHTESGFVVVIKNGAQIIFDSEDQWVSIDGRGETLPQMLLTDQLPAKVTDYLRAMEILDGVYMIQRSNGILRINLADSYFTYNYSTDILTYPEVKPS